MAAIITEDMIRIKQTIKSKKINLKNKIKKIKIKLKKYKYEIKNKNVLFVFFILESRIISKYRRHARSTARIFHNRF